LAPAVVNLIIEGLAVAGAAAIVGRNYYMALLNQFAHDRRIIRAEITAHPAVREDQQGIFATDFELSRDENISVDDQRIPGILRRRVRLVAFRPGVANLLDFSQLAELLAPVQIVNPLEQQIIGLALFFERLFQRPQALLQGFRARGLFTLLRPTSQRKGGK